MYRAEMEPCHFRNFRDWRGLQWSGVWSNVSRSTLGVSPGGSAWRVRETLGT